MLENFKRKKDDAKRISLLADAAVEWWANLYSNGKAWESQHRNLRPVLFAAGIWP